MSDKKYLAWRILNESLSCNQKRNCSGHYPMVTCFCQPQNFGQHYFSCQVKFFLSSQNSYLIKPDNISWSQDKLSRFSDVTRQDKLCWPKIMWMAKICHHIIQPKVGDSLLISVISLSIIRGSFWWEISSSQYGFRRTSNFSAIRLLSSLPVTGLQI